MSHDPERRRVLTLLTAATLLPSACAKPSDEDRRPGDTDGPRTDDTAVCEPACPVTSSDVEGPFYTPDAPTVADLGVDEAGTALVLTGRVWSCGPCPEPLADAVLDVWHADDDGAYDNEGFRLRGRFVCDADGRFTVRTILPGKYPERPVRHLHVKVRGSAGAVLLTTQIYAADDPDHDPGVHRGPAVAMASGAAEVDLYVDA